MLNTTLLIGDVKRDAANGATFDRINPLTGQAASRASAASAEDAKAAVAAAAASFGSWSTLGPSKRRMLLMRAAAAMEERAGEFVVAMAEETGATAGWAHFNVHLAANMLREAASMTTQVAGELIPSDKPGLMAMAVRQPVGVVLGIAPWNAPVILGVRAIAMPLACGNTVVLKSSEMCPATHGLIGNVLHDAGLGGGIVNVVSNAPENAASIVETLIGQKVVRRVNFTGSTRVGRSIAEIAAISFGII